MFSQVLRGLGQWRVVPVGTREMGVKPHQGPAGGATAERSLQPSDRGCTPRNPEPQGVFSPTCCRDPDRFRRSCDCTVSVSESKAELPGPQPVATTPNIRTCPNHTRARDLERKKWLQRGPGSSLGLEIQTEAFREPGLSCCGISGRLLNPSLSALFDKMRTKIHAETRMCTFTGASFTTAKKEEEIKCPSADEWTECGITWNITWP